jgi:hypothetical protein
MARSVTGLFATRDSVDSLDGALRDTGFEMETITIVGPEGQVVRLSGEAPHGIGAWLVAHLVHRGHPQAQAEQYHDSVAHEGRWLVSVTIRDDAQDSDARNLMVRSGADEISSVSDGHMLKIVVAGEDGSSGKQ